MALHLFTTFRGKLLQLQGDFGAVVQLQQLAPESCSPVMPPAAVLTVGRWATPRYSIDLLISSVSWLASRQRCQIRRVSTSF